MWTERADEVVEVVRIRKGVSMRSVQARDLDQDPNQDPRDAPSASASPRAPIPGVALEQQDQLQDQLIDPFASDFAERLAANPHDEVCGVRNEALVIALRAWALRGDAERVEALTVALYHRSTRYFYHYSRGLKHHQQKHEDVLGDMWVRFVIELRDPTEASPTTHYINWLICLCKECFTRFLVREGERYPRDTEGRPVVYPIRYRPLHVPRALQASLDVMIDDPTAEERLDPLQLLLSAERDRDVEWILQLIPDDTDRAIVELKILEACSYEEIGALLDLPSEFVTSRYNAARAFLAERYTFERALEQLPPKERQLIALYRQARMSWDEIGEAWGLPDTPDRAVICHAAFERAQTLLAAYAACEVDRQRRERGEANVRKKAEEEGRRRTR